MANLKYVLFDLDGTLLQLSNPDFERVYMGGIYTKVKHLVDDKTFISAMWNSTRQMVQDSRFLSNEDKFMEHFALNLGEDKDLNDFKPLFDQYYENEFDMLKSILKDNTAIREAVLLLKEKDYRCIIVTNPMFPKLAIEKRVEWTDVPREYFDYVTSFENNHYAKPNVKLYEEVLSEIGAQPSECMMVGNDTVEDMIAHTLGLSTYLVTDCQLGEIKEEWTDHYGNQKDFLEFVRNLPEFKE